MTQISKNCKHCDRIYFVFPYRVNKTKYCSKLCAYNDIKSKITLARNNVRKGKPLPLSTRKKQSEAMKLRVKNGEHHLWKGGVAHLNDTERKKDMDSFEYRNWRRLVFERDGYTCKVCNTKGIELNAHHKQSYADNPHLRFIEDNGVTLCKQCHIELHKKEKVHGIESDTIKDKLEELNGERK